MKFTQACWRSALSTLALGAALLGPASANPTLVVDVASGEVLYKDMATAPWFPASTTKLMTVYVALSKVREGRVSLDTPLRVSAYAASMEPSKMGFRPGTLVTLDNALKMLMVKSPNDIAVTIAEGISGSVPAFAEEMNAYAQRLGLHESHFVNPNGLPDPNHYSSARDMAMIARGLIREFPEKQDLFNIGALQFGGKLIPNHNGLLGPLPRRRRHEDRLHLFGRLQRRRERDPRRSPAAGGHHGGALHQRAQPARRVAVREILLQPGHGPRATSPTCRRATSWRRPTCAARSAGPAATTPSRKPRPRTPPSCPPLRWRPVPRRRCSAARPSVPTSSTWRRPPRRRSAGRPP